VKLTYTSDFSEIRMADVTRVGGKNASLGEMFRALKLKGVSVLDGFAVWEQTPQITDRPVAFTSDCSADFSWIIPLAELQ
jgi:hypothetical protein